MQIRLSRLQQGVTLIELLIVIVIMGSVLSLVGPYTFKQMDKFAAENEKSALRLIIQQQQFSAFQQQRAIKLMFEGKKLYILPQGALEHELEARVFEHLAFEQQTILVNQNGFLSTTGLIAYANGREVIFDLTTELDGIRSRDEDTARIYAD